VRERLRRVPTSKRARQRDLLGSIADLIGSVDGLPSNLSARKKRYLKSMAYGQKRAR
jgi:hypothetical protein